METLCKLKFREFVSLTENNNVGEILKGLYDQDQAERREYQNYLTRFPDWQQAVAAWTKDKQRSPDDVFGDAPRFKQAKEVISKNIKQIKKIPSWRNMAWLLVQHMDSDLPFQQWFLQHLPKDTTDWKYLTDRVLVNQGLPQKYSTQNV